MNEKLKSLIIESTPDQESSNALIGRLFDAAKPEAVFSEPVTSGDYTVITASEITVGMGAGYGGGGGFSPDEDAPDDENNDMDGGFGGGGGGGGGTMARPVAAISIGPDGVHVEPIVDPTKIAVAFFTTFFAMMMTLAKVRKFQKTQKLD